MILDELVLRNVGTFAGHHTIVLTPQSAKRPIVLIGGFNGAGKTTILDAIHLVLYGQLAQVSGRRTGSYDNYLRGLISYGTPPDEGAGIELSFHARRQGAERFYRVRRKWRSTGAGIRETLLVSVDGHHDEALTATWNDHVENFLPRGIAGLFFFDGEQIEAMADSDNSREVLSSALDALLGLDLVERLSTDLAVLRRRHQIQQVPIELRTAVDERQEVVTSLRMAEKSAEAAIANLQDNLAHARKFELELTERYRSAGGELAERRGAAEVAVKTAREALIQVNKDLRAELEGVAPLLQIKNMLREVARQVTREAEAQRHKVVAEEMAARDMTVIQQLQDADVQETTITAIEAYLAADRDQRSAAATIEIITGLPDASAISYLRESGLAETERRLRRLLEHRVQVTAELEQAERVLAAMPDPVLLAPLREERDAALAEGIRLQVALTQAEEQRADLLKNLERACTAWEVAQDNAARAALAIDDDQRLIEHVDRVKHTLKRLRTVAAERHLDRIAQLVLEALGHLLRKEQLVTDIKIDPETYTVELSGLDGRPLPTRELSAGERQLLAVALLWGLARAAGKPLPVIIDTPLGRLDRSHRKHLLDRYFPAASHQVILLSTDTEIDEDAYDRIARHIGRDYLLAFDPRTNATTVEPGYFWE